MDLLVGSVILLIGLFLGSIIAWLLARGRAQLQLHAALSQTKATSQIDYAQKEERLRAATEELATLRNARDNANLQYSDLRAELDRSRDDQARLEERSSRVPSLEGEIKKLTERIQQQGDELRVFATSEAQKQQLVSSLTSQASELESEARALTAKIAASTDALRETNERKAALEEQATRIPALENNINGLTEQLRKTEEELRRISSNEAQQRQLAESLKSNAEQSGIEHRAVEERLKVASRELQEANERKASLEEQVARIPHLERKLAATEERLTEINNQLTELKESSGRENGRLAAELSAEQQAHKLIRGQLGTEVDKRTAAESEVAQLTAELTELRTQFEAERKHADEKLQLLTQAKEELSAQFKSLATEILEEKSKRFTEQNQTNIGQLLEPLKTRLQEFQGKVEEVYVQEGKDRTALAEQVKQLLALNQALSEDAKNLTSALKGSSKTQGNWGELILERVLEASGLRKGDEYVVQDSQTREDGSRAQPDVVINLPEDRKLVVDSKVSLVAYETYASTDSDEERSIAIRQHVDSIRSHIRSLSDKQYHALYGKSLDFVLAFVPIEPAFMLAITNDKDLFMEAWRRNVLLVSPSTLLFVVRTVAHLWRQEAQNRNAQEIARRGAELYDKLCGFVADIETLGNRIKQAQQAYDTAQSKLVSGKGNVIRQAEMLRDLGVKPSKSLPQPLVELATTNEHPIVVVGALPEASDRQDASAALLTSEVPISGQESTPSP
ncbi:DNA recombination protein RmuC [Paraburkholderia pallida]|uniref:DNA recombination protein RmuC n=1 Tax=Paraburkholderia pallida TaxID=2547399 RepID=A0A4P7D193_9BURK|nr:DNA recombination protein RmuC [Paraburkholderia pallida]QBR02471.1 DNA recombination protein RmuC [Paraburkholderia pallida]